jgi:hypothetical protein
MAGRIRAKKGGGCNAALVHSMSAKLFYQRPFWLLSRQIDAFAEERKYHYFYLPTLIFISTAVGSLSQSAVRPSASRVRARA